ncbi:MAG: hypothetical protein Q8O93_04680 [bacterium]|nr:hypothetical protein [bacterium]
MALTPEQFALIATKEDLKDLRQDMATKTELTQVKSEILGAVDAVMVKLDNIEHAFVSNLAAHDRFEKRLTRIEKHLELSPAVD